MNPRRLIVATYIVLLGAGVLAAGAWFIEAHAEYRQLKVTETATRQLVVDAKKRLAEQQRTLERLKNDPAFVEKVLRQRLGYARPGEYIFRYED